MIPMVLARHIQSGLADYEETTFPMTNRPFRGAIRSLAGKEGELSQEPFVSVKLPFRVADESEEFPFSRCLHPTYRPYAHQMRAFARIAAGESTLVATGTGSGKTECFLYPILDYCYRQRRLGRKGIKAVLVYPMNALASDQAKRLATLIHESPELRSNVTAGMYVGQMSQGHDECMAMTESSIITSHSALLKNPPDILLTNYKMLDYLLVRPEDSQLWNDNDPDTLRYFVVDELHTFDGAQGTDLACLLRRLTDRLHADPADMCFIGTSATMGTDETVDSVCAYASDIFNTTFTPDQVVTEDRLQPEEFFTDADNDNMPTQAQANTLADLEQDVDPSSYLQTAAQAWLGYDQSETLDTDEARIRLGRDLQHSRFLAALVGMISGNPQQVGRNMLDDLVITDARFGTLNTRQQKTAVDALISLVSYARSGEAAYPRPFLNVQVQLWVKEFRRIVANIAPLDGEVKFVAVDELNKDEIDHYLPVINCRDCGGTAWVGITGKDERTVMGDPSAFYATFFAYQDSNLLALQPCDLETGGVETQWFCNQCMKATPVSETDRNERRCPTCGTDRIPMRVRVIELVAGNRKHYRCPFCGGEKDLSLVGVRSTSQISVMLSQLSGDAFNDDDKTIVFSDNVQDASYRASQFNARTWRFALRNSMMDYLDTEGKDGATLAEFLNGQNDYYHRRYPDDADYVVRFIAPNMTWMREYDAVIAGNPAGPDRARFLDWIGRRLRLEALNEFGLRSRTGRTLEKSGCAAISFDQRKLQAVARTLEERCRNEFGVDAGSVLPGDWIHIVMDLLDLLKRKGAFYDVTFDRFLENDGNKYLLSNKNVRWMPGMYAGGMPMFLSNRPPVRRGVFDTLDSREYRQLSQRYLTGENLEGEQGRDVLAATLDECVQAGFIIGQQYANGKVTRTVYGLSETGCHVSGHVAQLVCDACGRTYSCATENRDAWEGAFCRSERCAGRLKAKDDGIELGYYGKLYKAEPAERIHAAEHTGLLDGDTRNKLEKQFKSGEHHPGEVNVLACTPTLEMGIDIGDLSTVILSSIPPQQAQYIQRAGRAGRRDGNSLILAVANVRQHDLYYYQRPEDMLAGNVNPPHIFLEATAVLERQLTAYALDHWVHDMLQQNVRPADIVPKTLKECLRNIRQQADGFPANFLAYASANGGRLMNGFAKLFNFPEPVRDQLEAFIQGSSNAGAVSSDGKTMAARVYDVFRKTIEMLDEFERQRKELETMVAELDAKPDDSSYEEQKRECRDEMNSIGKMSRSVERTNTFNYLSDEGILPNYAFPENGVTLHTVLKADRMNDSESGDARPQNENAKRRETLTCDYVRPAASAITELAPGNTFYAGGRKFAINRIMCAKGNGEDGVTMWRLCPNCSHTEPASQSEHLASCPSCGSPQWADSGQKRPMMRINTVISEETYSESLVDDSSDTRTSARFVKDTLVDVDESDVTSAWRISGATDFGFEYVPQGTIREINFGAASADGPQVEIAGNKQIRRGFNVCMSCGALANENGVFRHSYSCPQRTAALEGTNASQCLFLYREVQSEILRMLVPGIADANGNGGAVESFTAAVMLGLELKFGNVDHLSVTLSNEPLKDGSGLRKTYLVIYDTVPGGTGYLKQLGSDPDTLIGILRQAYKAMDTCQCKSDDADGCYRCLFAYRRSRDLKRISRRTAEDMIAPIIDESNKLVKIETVSNVPVNKLFDSTLEQQFIEALRKLHANPAGATDEQRGMRASVVDDVISNKQGYTLTVNERKWEVEPQVSLGPVDGVPVYCKPDFVLKPVGNETEDNAGAASCKPIAIFTDGLRYHAGIVSDDTAKREALRMAGYRVWTLTYDDVIGYVQGERGKQLADPALNVNALPAPEKYRLVVNGKADMFDPSEMSAMDMLGCYLASPDAERMFSTQARGFGFALCLPKRSKRSVKGMDVEQVEQGVLGESASIIERSKSEHAYGEGTRLKAYIGVHYDEDNPQMNEVHVGLVFDDADVQEAVRPEVNVDENWLPGFDDDERLSFKQQWSGFWHTANLLQFLPAFYFVTSHGLTDESVYEALRDMNQSVNAVKNIVVDDSWKSIFADETFGYLDEEEKAAAKTFSELQIPAPEELGYELVEDGEIVGSAELAWEDRRIVFIPTGSTDDESRKAFTEHGWHIINEYDEHVAELFAKTGKDI